MHTAIIESIHLELDKIYLRIFSSLNLKTHVMKEMPMLFRVNIDLGRFIFNNK